jgi:hypothetical protein
MMGEPSILKIQLRSEALVKIVCLLLIDKTRATDNTYMSVGVMKD